MLRTSTRAGFVAGILATIALLGVLLLVGPWTGVSFAPYDLADIVIRLTPGFVATQGIETLGIWAKITIKLATVVALVLLGGAIGALKGWADARSSRLTPGVTRNIAAFALFLCFFALALLNTEASGRIPLDPISFLALLALMLGWGALLQFFVQRLNVHATSVQDTAVADTERRTFLIKSGAAVITLAVGSTALAELWSSEPAAAVNTPYQFPQPDAFTAESPYAARNFVAPPGVRARVTPQDELYYVSSRVRDPRVDATTYKLSIEGNVDKPFTLTLDELQRLPRIKQTSTLECISNEVGGDLIGNCTWLGTPLADLLQRAGLRPQSQRVALYGADGYVDSIALEDALKPTTLVVYAIDDQPLTVPHGFPVRLIVPNIYGMKNVKWLQKIDVVTFDTQGYWQERGWSQSAIVKTTSVIDTTKAQAENGVLPLGGIAFAGSRGVQKVEVRIDEQPWVEATLEPEHTPRQWRRWRYDWSATPGGHSVQVRGTDGAGELQTDQVAQPHPDGASGYHFIRINV